MSSTTRVPGTPGLRPRLAAVLVLASVLSAVPPGAFAESPPVRLEWTAVAGARSYLVEVRAVGGLGLVFSASAAETWIEAPLVPGDYEIRVSALNVFGKAVAPGEWTLLSVRATARLEAPALRDAPAPDPAEPGRVVLRVRVTGVLPDTKAALVGPGGRVEAARVELEADGLAASFELSRVPEGDYDLVLENPGGYAARIAAAVRVAASEPAPEPRMEPETETGTELIAGTDSEAEPEPGLELETGRELAAGTELESEPELAPEPETGTELEPGPGAADAAGTEPEPEPDVASVEPSPASDPGATPTVRQESDAAAELGHESAQARPREPLPLRYEVSLGWRPAFALDADWGGSYGAGWAGVETSLGLRFAEPAPAWLRVLSVELRADSFRLPGITGAFVDAAEALALSASLELGAAWRPLDWLEFALRGGGALFATHVTRTGLIGDFDAWSLGDPAVQSSLSTRFLLDRFLVETGCAWQHVFYLDVPADFLRPFLRFGWSFGR